jgi:hypothetical protein
MMLVTPNFLLPRQPLPSKLPTLPPWPAAFGNQPDTNQRSRYNIKYRRQQSTSTIGTNTNNRDAISDAIMPSEYPHAPDSPLHLMQHLDNTAADTATTATYQRRHNYSL